MPKKIEAPKEIYQIKVTLLHSKSPIWRRLLVPADMTLAKLHGVLQEAMGWYGEHLHEFRIGGESFGVSDPEYGFMGGDGPTNETKIRLFEVLGMKGAKAVYTYDFGDDWEHSIVVEKVLPPVPGTSYPACTDGKRHCPPEDCGGVYGYYNFLEAIADPEHEEHDQLLEWIGGAFDPEAFSIDEVNQRLATFQRPRRK